MPRSETLLIGNANSYVLPVADVAAHTTTSKVDGTPIGTGGMHQYDGLGDGAYVAFIRAGGSPASTDEVAGQISALLNVANVEADEAAIAAAVLAGIQPSSNTFTGSVVTPGQETITVYQRDDYSASDGRAFDFSIVDAAIDFTNATVIKGPAGGQRSLVSDRIEATPSLQNKLNGSCTLRIEFTSAQLNQPAGQYQFNALVLVNGRRVTKLDLIVNVETQNADVAS